MNKKVAIITERADINLGGAERSVFELYEALTECGLEADILAAKGNANAENIRILCDNASGRRVCYFTFEKILKKYLTENHYDILHSVLPFGFADVYQPRGGSFPESIRRNALSYRNKLIESCKKTTAFANLRRTILFLAEKKLCRNPDGPLIVAISNYVAEQFKQHYGVGDDRIVVIPNGVRTDKSPDINEAKKLRTKILAEFALNETDRPVFLLFAANNFRLKGLECLIRALRLAADNKTDRQAYLVVVGGGRTQKYRLLAKKLNIQKKIAFLGAIPHIETALSIIDVAVLPTFYDPSSRFILEAIVAAKPVITTKHNGAADLFVDNRHGRIIDSPENLSALAEAIGFFSNTENIHKTSEKIAADNLIEKISINRVAKQLDSVYNRIIGKRRRQ